MPDLHMRPRRTLTREQLAHGRRGPALVDAVLELRRVLARQHRVHLHVRMHGSRTSSRAERVVGRSLRAALVQGGRQPPPGSHNLVVLKLGVEALRHVACREARAGRAGQPH